jgi:signal transduction histidine kinase
VPPPTLRGRLALGFVVLAIATWLTVGAALFFALRGLHSEATSAHLADVALPLVARVRADAAAGLGLQAVLDDLGTAAADAATEGTSIHLVLADGRVVQVGEGDIALPTLPLDPSAPPGTIEHGTVRVAGTSYAWSATVLRAGVRGSRALVVATPDRSVPQALGDLLGTLPLVVAVTLLVGLLVVTWLSRSVTEPLRRLSLATRSLAARDDREPLLHDGPIEVRELSASFETMRNELTDARRREAELLADLRHDLRTPLTVIAGFAAALTDGTASGEAAGRAAEAIARETARMTRLVDDLGTAAGEGPGNLRPEPIDAAAVVVETVERFSTAAREAGVAITSSVGDGATVLVADRGALERILANLVQNALAAIGPNARTHPAGHVRIDARRTGDGPGAAVVLSVTDDGPGFPAGLAARAFDRFVRGDPARSGSGSGLGLAIVRELAAVHGGSVVAENLSPRGARVSVTLPAAGPSATPPDPA